MDPDAAQIAAWVTDAPEGNAALRLPHGVVGLDVDAYGDKRGDRTLARHVQALGPLEPTWTIVNREGGRSGTSLYRCAFEGPFRSSLDGGDVDLIHRGHRYCVLPPSLHPEGRQYMLLGPDGQPAGRVPTQAELPLLPNTWHAALQAPRAPQRAISRAQREPRPTLQRTAERDKLIQEAVYYSASGKAIRDRAGVTHLEAAARLGMDLKRFRRLEAGSRTRQREAVLIAYGALLKEWADQPV